MIAHFFRHQSAKMVSVLSQRFGLSHFELVEDCVQETMIDAMEQWALQGTPNNPEGWLMDVAKKKLLNQLKRQHLFDTRISATWAKEFARENTVTLLEENTIQDAQLRMIFACCHPAIQKEAQIALALKTLCGFGLSEIAQALFITKETLQKQLYRAKQVFKKRAISLAIPEGAQLETRLNMVLKTLYLLFNEGYFSIQTEVVMSKDLCFEAIRLAQALESSFPNYTPLKALLALMFLQFARFESRLSDTGALLLFNDQDRSQWHQPMMMAGIEYLTNSQGEALTSYHLQAGILAEYVLVAPGKQIDLPQITQYYTLLLELYPSEIVRLNYAIVLYQKGEKSAAFELLHQLTSTKKLKNHWLLYYTLGELYQQESQLKDALMYWKQCSQTKVPKALQTKLTEKIDALNIELNG